MPSNLYRQALDSLSDDERAALASCLEWLETHTGSLPADPTDGARILANLQEEAHLVGDRDFGDASELADFLRRCAARFAACTPEERHRGFQGVCDEFILRGLRVLREHLPDALLRYVTSRAVAADLIRRMLGRLARADFDSRTFPPETFSARLRRSWKPSRLSVTDRLARGSKVFATFEHPAGAPRHDAKALSQALALSFWQNPPRDMEVLVEFTYSTDAVENHRFPTVADAGWGCLFRPAPEEVPDAAKPTVCCGWTEPFGSHPPQPEIVHDNAPLRVLSEPPRLVGAIP